MHILKEKFGSSCTNVEFIFFFFFLLENEQSTVLAPKGATTLCPSPSFFIPSLIRGVKNWLREKRCLLYKCVWAVPAPDKLLLLPSSLSLLTKTKTQAAARARYGVSRSTVVLWTGVLGTWALPFSPRVGRMAGTVENRAARREAIQATGGMFSSCPLHGLPRPVWLSFQIFVCRRVMEERSNPPRS